MGVFMAGTVLRVHQIYVDETDDVVDRLDGRVGGAVGVEELRLVEMVDGFALLTAGIMALAFMGFSGLV